MQQEESTSRVGSVFYVSVFIAVLFVIWGVFFSGSLEAFNTAAMGIITESFGWVYLIATTLFIVFLFFLAFSRFGKIRLGKDEDRPEFSTMSWLAMLFSAGMGIGLVFLRGSRAHAASVNTAALARGRAGYGEGRTGGYAVHFLPLGACTPGLYTGWSPSPWPTSSSARGLEV